MFISKFDLNFVRRGSDSLCCGIRIRSDAKKIKIDFNLASGDVKKTSNILITRAKENCSELLSKLEASGFSCFCEPLFTIKKNHVEPQNWTRFSAAIITSANAIDSLLTAKFPQNLKIFCVGKITAQKHKAAGFSNIKIAPQQNADSLLKLIESDDDTGSIAYFHGSIISLDFAKKLPNVVKIAAYETKNIDEFSADFLKFSEETHCDYVLIFSANSAKVFLENAKKHNLLAYFRSSHLLCLSKQITEEVREICNELGKEEFARLSTFKDSILKEIYDYD